MKRSTAIIVSAAVLMLSAIPALAGPIEQARGLLNQKKYDQAEKVLEPMLRAKNPPAEALKLSLSAAVARGRYVTAQRRATRLLEVTQNKDLELIFQAAQVAHRAGDFKLARTRYLIYAQKVAQATPKLEQAIRYLLQRGAYPEAYVKYVKLFGATPSAWRYGNLLLDRLIEVPDPDKALEIAELMLKRFRRPAEINSLVQRVHRMTNTILAGRKSPQRFLKPMQMVISIKPPLATTPEVFSMFDSARHGRLKAPQLLAELLTVQEVTGKPVPKDYFQFYYTLGALPDANARYAVGKRLLGLEKMYYDNPDPEYYLNFLTWIATQPQMFRQKDRLLVTNAHMLQKLDALKAKFARSPQAIRPVISELYLRWFGGDKATQAALLRKHLAVLDSGQVDWLMTVTDGADLEAVEALLKGKSFHDALDIRVALMRWYTHRGGKAHQAVTLAAGALAGAKDKHGKLTKAFQQADAKAKQAETKAAQAQALVAGAKGADAARKKTAAQNARNTANHLRGQANNIQAQLRTAQADLTKAGQKATQANNQLAAAQRRYGPAVLAAARDYMSCYPGTFDWRNVILPRFISSPMVTDQQKLAVLGEIITKGGHSKPMATVIGEMARNKAWAKQPQFVALKQAFDRRPVGGDAIMAAHVAMGNLKRDANYAKNTLAICKKLLTAYRGRVPSGHELTHNTTEELLVNILLEHRLAVFHNPPAAFVCAELWAPRLNPGSAWVLLADLADRHRGFATLGKIAPYYVAQVAPPTAKGSDDVWKHLCHAANPKDKPASLFAGVYAKMGWENAFTYVFNQPTWRGAKQQQLLVNELAKLVKTPGFKFTSRGQVKAVVELLDIHWGGVKLKAPPALLDAMWAYYLGEENRTGSYDPVTELRICRTYRRTGDSRRAAAQIGTYINAIRPRSLPDQIEAVQDLVAMRLPEEKGSGVKPGMARHTVLRVLKPILDRVKPDTVAVVQIDRESAMGALGWANPKAKLSKQVKAEADLTTRRMVELMVAGASYAGNRNEIGGLVEHVLSEAIQRSDWNLASELLVYEASILGQVYDLEWAAGQRVAPICQALTDKGANELVYAFITSIEKLQKPAEKVHRQLLVIKSRAARQIPDIISVPPSDPTYDLHLAAHALSVGRDQRAWNLTARRLSLLPKTWESLPPEYVTWVLEQMRRRRQLKRALSLSFAVLTAESRLDADVAATVLLIKGDIYRDMQNYQAARAEYDALKNNRRYRNTPSGKQARLRQIDLMIITKDYTAAEGQLERLVDSNDVRIQAEAYYLWAKMAFARQEYKDAKKYIQKVRQRVVDHVEAALLEGELNLKLPGGLADTEVKVGDPRLATVAIPGRVLTLKLRDFNLAVARGGAAVPVVVSTSKGKDFERVKLLSGTSDRNLFIGRVATSLGKVAHNNHVLELRGDDVVSYEIDPAFQKAHGIKYPPKHLEVRYTASLAASSGEILTEQELEQRALEEEIRARQEGAAEARRRARGTSTVRPGSGIYVQVTDLDRDVSDAPDKVTVSLKTTSGDALGSFSLTETGTHTGIFRGVVPTGLPLPKASASDTEEGRDVACLINSTKKGVWSSLADGAKGKWVQVDTMSSHLVKEASILMPSPKRVRRLRLLGMLADDFVEIASYPAREGKLTGGLVVQYLAGGTANAQAIRNALKLKKHKIYHHAKPAFDRKDTGFAGKGGWVISRVTGTFYLSANRSLELKFIQKLFHQEWQSAYLYIDGQLVLGGRINNNTLRRTRRVDLAKGAHRLELLVCDHAPKSHVIVGYRRDDGTFAPLPAKWFSTKDTPQLAEYLKPRGTIERQDTGFTATLSKPIRFRRLRWVFEDFSGNAVSASRLIVKNDKGKTVIPVQRDFASGMTNSTLEISPGDEIEITYQDEKHLNSAPPVLRAEMNCAYYNGRIELNYEVPGRRSEGFGYYQAKRCRIGDALMIIVTDPDADLTDKRDVVDVNVWTSSGEKLTIKALESHLGGGPKLHKHAGQFAALLRIGKTTGKDSIKVKPDDRITVSYLDRENTTPGIPVERRYVVAEVGKSTPKILVYRTKIETVEDTSPDAQARVKRMRMANKNVGKIFKRRIVARHPEFQLTATAPAASPASGPIPVSGNAPLLFEVTYPALGLHSASELQATAVAESELRAAKKENRPPTVLTVPMRVMGIEQIAGVKGYPIRLQSHERRHAAQMLEEGVFAGVIRLQLGKAGDAVDDMVLTGANEFTTRQPLSEDDFQNRVPTLIVSGGDVVHLRVKDLLTGKQVTSSVRLLSDGRLELLDKTYVAAKTSIYLGEKFYLKVADPDRDSTDERDTVIVTAASSSGDTLKITLTETLTHSGVFTGSVQPQYAGRGSEAKKRINKADSILHLGFGDKVTFAYTDSESLVSSKPRQVASGGGVFFGADAELACFTKRFRDVDMAVRTRFLMAEALFEMAKKHRQIGRAKQADEEIARGKRILAEALRDYPKSSLAAQGQFLLANLAQELGSYQEAITRYARVISIWPESEYAVRSQFKKAICLEKMGDYDTACEEYVKLTYVYPESSLASDATVRLANYYTKKKDYKTAGRIYERFQQRNPSHRLAARSLFLGAQCYFKMKEYETAIDLFERLVKTYVDDKELRPQAMYWIGDCYYKSRNYVKAYQAFKKLTWDYPADKWAKIARGRLTEEAFDRFSESKD